jgi:hypothetical protein
MLPTQFIPEYYRDAKDIKWQTDEMENKHDMPRQRQSLFARILQLFRRPVPEPERKAQKKEERTRPAH